MFVLGLILISSSIAIGVTRFFTQGEAIALLQVEREKQQKKSEEDKKLGVINSKLKNIPNKIIREYFRDLIQIKKSFEEAINAEDIRSRIPLQFDDSFIDLFW